MPRILIVDDSPTSRAVARRALERGGFTATEACSGEEALVSAASDPPDLVLMDVVMPGVNGFQATRKLVRDPRTAEIPVIIVTSKDQPTDRIWGLRQGARGYLVKPVADEDLLAAVRQVLGLGDDRVSLATGAKAGA